MARLSSWTSTSASSRMRPGRAKGPAWECCRAVCGRALPLALLTSALLACCLLWAGLALGCLCTQQQHTPGQHTFSQSFQGRRGGTVAAASLQGRYTTLFSIITQLQQHSRCTTQPESEPSASTRVAAQASSPSPACPALSHVKQCSHAKPSVPRSNPFPFHQLEPGHLATRNVAAATSALLLPGGDGLSSAALHCHHHSQASAAWLAGRQPPPGALLPCASVEVFS
jgi:hypothetical protein